MHAPAPGVHTGGFGHEHAPQVHVAEHVLVPYVLHACMPEGAQTPWFMHEPATHMPLASHVSVSVPQLPQADMRVWPGAHTPLHAPLTHVWFMHATALPHCPVASHVCTPLLELEHCVLPGTQTPLHAPARQT